MSCAFDFGTVSIHTVSIHNCALHRYIYRAVYIKKMFS